MGVAWGRTHRFVVPLLASLLAASVLALAVPGERAYAATFLVNVPADTPDSNPGDGRCDIDGLAGNGDQCTLRAAIQQANASGAGPHGIVLTPGIYTLTRTGAGEDAASTGDLDILRTISIVGAGGPQATFIQAGADADSGVDRVFDVRPGGSLTLSLLTVRNGRPKGSGGVIRDVGGTLTLNFVEVTGGVATAESGETGDGAGIAVVAVTGQSTALTATNATIANNVAGGRGGGISNEGGTVTLTNVTISDNEAGEGGGIFTTGPTSLSFVTIAGNDVPVSSAAGGVDARQASQPMVLRASILSENDRDDCRGPATSQGSNILDDGDCITTPAAGDVLGRDEDLLPLSLYGGLVRTRPPTFDDNAIDGVDLASPAAAACPTTDARGQARPQDGDGNGSARCDVGAHELSVIAVNNDFDLDDSSPGNGECDAIPASAGNQCSLRAAIQEANARPDPVAVVLPAGTYALARAGRDEDEAANGDLDLKQRTAVFGAGADRTTVDGAALDRVFEIQPNAVVTMANLRVTGGDAQVDDGGGIRVLGRLSLIDARIEGNRASRGGGISAEGGPASSVSLRGVTVQANLAQRGGGLSAIQEATANILDSTFAANDAVEAGGAMLLADTPNVFVTNGTISGNRVAPRAPTASLEAGGGIMAEGGSLNLRYVTVADNQATGSAGGNLGAAGLQIRTGTLVNVTISIIGRNGIVNGARVNPECSQAVISRGGNVVADTTCITQQGPNDAVNVDPLLGPLASNGGPTQTHALLGGSPAIDRVALENPSVVCFSGLKDQRGLPRPVDAGGGLRCDSGAFEVQNRRCEPRPRVAVTVTRGDGGRVTVTVRPTTNEGTTGNGLRRIQFGPTTRATLDLSPFGTSRGNTTVTPPSPDGFTFVILPDGPGTSNLAPFVVTDDCGDWRTFAGAGAAATSTLGGPDGLPAQGSPAPAPAPAPDALPTETRRPNPDR